VREAEDGTTFAKGERQLTAKRDRQTPLKRLTTYLLHTYPQTTALKAQSSRRYETPAKKNKAKRTASSLFGRHLFGISWNAEKTTQ
jgi:hypothetical protein